MALATRRENRNRLVRLHLETLANHGDERAMKKVVHELSGN